MELKISEMQELKPIDFNFEELKAELSKQLEKYQNIVYTDDTIKIAADDRTKLNKLSKTINDRKIEIHKEYDKPYKEFEEKIKIILNMINEPLQLIDKQIKDYEQRQKDEKREQIQAFFDTQVGDYADLVSLDNIFNEKWLNKTYKMATIEEDIKSIFNKISGDMQIIDGQMKDEAINKQVKAFYFNNISNESVLSLSLQEGMTIIENNKKLEELSKMQKTNEILTKSEKVFQKEDNEQIFTAKFWAQGTQEQLTQLGIYLKNNNIKYGKVE